MALPLQILPQEETLGSKLGTALGSGINQGLQNLAQMKMQELAKRNVSRGLQSPILNFSPEEAQMLSNLDSASLNQIIKQRLAQPQQESYAQAINALLGGNQQPMENQINTGSQNQQTQQQTDLQNQLFGQQATTTKTPSLKGLTEQQATNLAKLSASERKLQLEKDKAAKKELRDMRKEERDIQKDIDTETKPFYDEITKGAKSAEQTNKKLSRMEKLINEGKLGVPIINTVLSTFKEGAFGTFGPKINLDFLKTADAQEFEKLVADFLPEVKDFFPGRVTNQDLTAFFARLPELTKSKAGNLRLINSLKAANAEKLLRKQLTDQIIEQNNGRRPRNLDQLVEKAGKAEFDKLYKEFINAPRILEDFGGGIIKY